MEREAFVRHLGKLARTYGMDLSKGRLEGYWEGLADLDEEDFEHACRVIVRESKFFPSVAELRDIAVPAKGYQPGDGQYTPMPDFRPAAIRIAEYQEDQARRLAEPKHDPVAMSEALAGAMKIVRDAAAARKAQGEPKAMTQEEQDARKAALREQLEMLKREGKA